MSDIMDGGPKVRRWTEQRWAIDNVLRSVGIDWDQPRSFYRTPPAASRAAPTSPRSASA